MLSEQEIIERIDGISETLKRPGVANVERLLLHEDRKDLRAMLEKVRQAKEPRP